MVMFGIVRGDKIKVTKTRNVLKQALKSILGKKVVLKFLK